VIDTQEILVLVLKSWLKSTLYMDTRIDEFYGQIAKVTDDHFSNGIRDYLRVGYFEGLSIYTSHITFKMCGHTTIEGYHLYLLMKQFVRGSPHALWLIWFISSVKVDRIGYGWMIK